MDNGKYPADLSVYYGRAEIVEHCLAGQPLNENAISVLNTVFTVQRNMVNCTSGSNSETIFPIYTCRLNVSQFDIMPRGFCFDPTDPTGVAPLYPWTPKCSSLIEYDYQIMSVSKFKSHRWK